MKTLVLLPVMLLMAASCSLFAQNVGIGTSSPQMRLHVSKADSAIVLLENTQPLANDIGTALYFKTGLYFTGAIKTIGDGTNTSRLALFSYATSVANSVKERISILDNGMVGIGTTAPIYPLEVNGRMGIRHTTATAGIWYNKSDNTPGPFIGNYNDSVFGVYNNDGGGWQFYFDHKNARLGMNLVSPKVALSFPASTGKKISLYPGTNGDVGFDVWGNELRIHSDYSGADITFGYDTYPSTFVERMRVKGSGAVCIGTTDVAAGYILNVGGKAIAEEMRVQLRAAWPDYVFDEGYELPSLESVERFVQENKHLPDVPDAAQVQQEGIMLGDMQTRMVRKIEELTLYLIQQQKELEQLKHDNLIMKEQMGLLQVKRR